MASLRTNTTIVYVDTNGVERTLYSKGKTTSSIVRSSGPIEIPITAGGTAVLFDFTASGSTDNFTDYAALFLWADAAIDIEFRVNEGTANENTFSIRLAADVPFQIWNSASYDRSQVPAIPGGITFLAAGANSVINYARASNYSANTVTVTRFMVK